MAPLHFKIDRLSLLRHGLSLLANRPHSKGELSSKLFKVNLRALKRDPTSPPINVSEVVEELATTGALNDTAYAQWHTQQRAASNGRRVRSRAQLMGELSRKRVDLDVASTAISETHNELLSCALVALRKGYTGTKLRTFLTNKAYGHLTIQVVLEAVQTEGVHGLHRIIESQREEKEGIITTDDAAAPPPLK